METCLLKWLCQLKISAPPRNRRRRLDFCFEGCNQPWSFFILLLCCSSFVQKEKEKNQLTSYIFLHGMHLCLWKGILTPYFSSWCMWSLLLQARLLFFYLLCWVRYHLMNHFWVDCFTSRLLYSLTNLHHALQHNFKFKELATRDTKFEDKGCGREDYYMNGSLNKSEQNTLLIHNSYKYIFQR